MEKTLEKLVLTRSFAVAPDKVWRAWIDAAAMRVWFGQAEAPTWQADWDVRAGGNYRLVMRDSGGRDYTVQGVYREVVPNRKLAFTWTWPRTTPERESLVTILFRPDGGGTELDFVHAQHFDEAVRDGHLRGWSEAFVKLERFLQGA